eukprot:g21999.t1
MKEELKEILISQEIVLGKLMGLKLDKSPGPDGLHPRVLQEVAPEIGALMRPHLEYFVQFWPPGLRKGILAIERVQRRFTRLIRGMAGLTYEERLDRLGLYLLEFRRMRRVSHRNIQNADGTGQARCGKNVPDVREFGGHSLRIK